MITIEPGLFDYDEELDYSPEAFVVSSDFSPAAIVEALNRAADRFSTVGDNGEENLDPDEAAHAGIYTLNYVSDPKITESGVEMWVDGKGAIDPPMALTLRRILVVELSRAVPSAHVAVVLG